MEMKTTGRMLAAVLAAAVLCTASCASEKKETTAAATASAAAETVSASEITGAVLAEVPISSSFERGKDGGLENYFNSLDVSGLEDASYCMCASGAFPDEIAVFKFSSDQLAKDGVEAVKERMEQQRSTYETYTPKEMYKFDDAVARASGSWVIYLITSDNAAAEKVVNSYIS